MKKMKQRKLKRTKPNKTREKLLTTLSKCIVDVKNHEYRKHEDTIKVNKPQSDV
jgi:hypothetical protein